MFLFSVSSFCISNPLHVYTQPVHIWKKVNGQLVMLGMIIALPLTTLMLSYYQRFIINKEKIKYDEVETTDNQETSHNEEK